MEGRTVLLEPLVADRHAAELWAAFGEARNPDLWRYIGNGPFETEEAFWAWLRATQGRPDWVSLAIRTAPDGRARGIANYMRIDEGNGVAEVGCILYGEGLAREVAATEAMMLMADRVFAELGYRRYEWKCDAENLPSRRAALRLGFTFEGTFRNHMVVKGRNRDTAWFAIVDCDWPAIRTALRAWLDPSNFDAEGRQVRRLESFRA